MYTLVKKRSGAGCSSQFYKLKHMNRGFKTFTCIDDAEIAHLNQTELAEHDLAPQVYSPVCRVRNHDGSLSHWGFITEMAETIKRPKNVDYYDCEDEYREELDELIDECDHVGYCFGDCHLGNVGYIVRNGYKKMVVIDTGDESITSDRCYCVTCRNGGCCHE